MGYEKELMSAGLRAVGLRPTIERGKVFALIPATSGGFQKTGPFNGLQDVTAFIKRLTELD